jgi:hypothetical protein
MEKIMKPLHIGKRGPLLGTYKKFHIYEITRQKVQLNDSYTDVHNPIYNVITATYQNV